MKYMRHSIEANKLIVLGRGIERHEDDGREFWRLSSASQARAEATAGYYHENRHLFRRMGRLIVCSGGYAGLGLAQDKPPEGINEAIKMAAYLRDKGVPSSLIEVEGNSISTFSNFEECLRQDFFVDIEFSQEDPLLLVASKQHGRYRAAPIAKAAYGIAESSAVRVLSAEQENRRTAIREAVGGVATCVALREASVKSHDPDSLAKAARIFEGFTSSPATLIPAVFWSYVRPV